MLHELLNGHTIQGLWRLPTKEKCEPFLKYKDKFYHEYMDLALIDGEQFSEHPDNPDIKASNLGRVIYKGKIMPQIIESNGKSGYLAVQIPGEKFTTNVHKLVAETFLKKDNPDPATYNIIHHISGNIYDNRAENLLYVTCEQHTLIHHGDMRICFGNIENNNCRWRHGKEKCAFDNSVFFSETMSPDWEKQQREMRKQYEE
jgi:DNA-directed RNA polymerase subunit L